MEENTKKLIAVYGSLRKGMHNHLLLDTDGAEYLETTKVKLPYKMIPYSSFPALIPDDVVNEITFEIYAVDDNVYKQVERLEGYPDFYDKDTVEVFPYQSPIEFYTMKDEETHLKQRFADYPHIVDWCAFKKLI